ncbi:MAG: F0F1 ATP synthase subunit gamma [Candidatus Obscuribacterales bacterium]|nr:F0F1 ATP synthase subunit gamma [Candidatus Obscuribacterales bacterium]
MSDSLANLRRKIDSAGELLSVVRTMKTIAAASVVDYEKSVVALADYDRTVQLGLHTCLKQQLLHEQANAIETISKKIKLTTVLVFGSDQGLVGQFNNAIVDFMVEQVSVMGVKPTIWAVGERVCARLTDSGLQPSSQFAVPTSVNAIGALVTQILLKSETLQNQHPETQFFLFYNRLKATGLYEPTYQELLPLDKKWRDDLVGIEWPSTNLPQIVGDYIDTLRSLVSEYLFVSIFRACAESLASENSSRLTSMQRADKNIGELLSVLNGRFHKLRQSAIDDELFDVISGFEALTVKGLS